MSSAIQIFIFSLLLFCSFNPFTSAQPSFRPRALVLSITKDASTLQYLTIVNQRTPLASINVVVDLGGQFLWVDCDQFYQSSSYVPARCGSAQCNLAGSKACTSTSGELAQDVFAIQSTNGKNPGPVVSIPRLLFTCGSTFLLEGLASGVRGMAGLGRSPIGLPSQFAAAFSFNRKFAICLPSSISANGVIFFGNTPYIMMPDIDISSSLMYTPLLINPVSTASSYTQGDRSTEYFIGVKSIQVNTKSISLNTTLLSIQSNGYGGTKISTVNPYTVLETSIYNALTKAFVREANLPRVAPIAPLEFCFDSTNVASTRLGPGVPSIDLVLQSENVVWRITGSNSMVQVRDNVLCLGFVDGGSNPRTSIVIGGHQLEDNLLQFDLATSRLGFSSSLLGRQTTCSNFNFTSNA
ncbi:Aspartyl protease family protein [Thalictrum thalictroides]|uniref:Aspartyl protease family protein n=1 Tax=Thalictrum thalictroides TaxID=46969 RepID=A0A7J6VLZ6_THATH|nr:Aspartyl protease family protein [Thalictrum thalictroides]